MSRDPLPVGRLLSVNVGRPRPIDHHGELTTTAIVKTPVQGPVAVRGVNVDGDDQADRQVHGGPDQAIYAYAREDYEWWEAQLGQKLDPGMFGENLTVDGIDCTGAVVGERWRIGTVTLEVSSPRIPCWKLARRMEDPVFQKRFGDAGRPGAYMRIIEEGVLSAGDGVHVLHRPDHEVTVALISQVRLHTPEQAHRLLAAPELPAGWRRWAEKRARAA
jgi:MOSC domain-containing protein YiiM